MKKIGLLLSIIALTSLQLPVQANEYVKVRISEEFDDYSLDNSHQSIITFEQTKSVELTGQAYNFHTTAGICEKAGVDNCTNGVGSYSILPECENDTEKYCLENVLFEGRKAQFIGYSPGKIIEADGIFVFARGASTSFWEVTDENSQKRVIAARVVLKASTTWLTEQRPSLKNIEVDLAEVKITNEKYFGHTFEVTKDYYGMDELKIFEKTYQPNCYVSFQDKCAELVGKPGVNLSVEMRISDLAASWFTGRISNVKISISEGRNRILSVSGNTVSVPELEVDALRTDLADKPFYSRSPIGNSLAQTATNGLLLFGFLLEKYTQKSKVSNVYWSINSALGAQAGPCFTKKPGVGGFATTNAMVYNTGNPVVVGGEIVYLIGSTHLDENGIENRGTYDLALRSDVARCLYGLNNAPIKAEISVLSEDGQKQVATTTFGEKDGWMYVGAYNFTFSSPKIKVKLTQATKKVTIKCVKGNVKKSVSGIKPVCPTGYKKAV